MEELLSPEQAAKILGIEAATLTKWRNRRRGPRFVRLGNNTVRYKTADLQTFIDARVTGVPESPKRRRKV